MHIELRPTLVVDSSPHLKATSLIDLIWLADFLKSITKKGGLDVIYSQSPSNYTSALEKLALAEASFSNALMIRTKDNEIKLTNFGIMFIEFAQEIRLRSAQENISCDKLIQNMKERSRFVENTRWRFHSSSDALMEKAVYELNGFELKIVDSSEAIHKLLINETDIAGYNTSNQKYSISIFQHFLQNNIQAFPVTRRTQGLLVKKGNPLDIHSIADLARNKVRFINRQNGSGTRILLDELLQKEGISPRQINGYIKEELRHTSVANAILANQADVGLGLGDVALTSNLGFIPLREEIFFIAVRSKFASEPKMKQLIDSIRSSSRKTPGYSPFHLTRDFEKWTGCTA